LPRLPQISGLDRTDTTHAHYTALSILETTELPRITW
jgi:hypothetical protein